MRRPTMLAVGGALLLGVATACTGEIAGNPSAGGRPTVPTIALDDMPDAYEVFSQPQQSGALKVVLTR